MSLIKIHTLCGCRQLRLKLVRAGPWQLPPASSGVGLRRPLRAVPWQLIWRKGRPPQEGLCYVTLVGAGRRGTVAGMLHAPVGPGRGLAGPWGTNKHSGPRPGARRAVLLCEGSGRAFLGSRSARAGGSLHRTVVWPPRGSCGSRALSIFPERPLNRGLLDPQRPGPA